MHQVQTQSAPAVLLRLPEVKRMTCMSTATIYRLMAKGIFPLAIRTGNPESRNGKVAWWQHEVIAYLESRARISSRASVGVSAHPNASQ